MPAMRAAASTSPLVMALLATLAVVSAAMNTRQRANARRWVASLGASSRLRAPPSASRWVRLRSTTADILGCQDLGSGWTVRYQPGVAARVLRANPVVRARPRRDGAAAVTPPCSQRQRTSTAVVLPPECGRGAPQAARTTARPCFPGTYGCARYPASAKLALKARECQHSRQEKGRARMPTYEYACTSCGEHIDVVQSFRDDPLTTCPACGGPLRKVFSSIGVVFKGSGFYKTDSRDKAKSSSTSSEKSS